MTIRAVLFWIVSVTWIVTLSACDSAAAWSRPPWRPDQDEAVNAATKRIAGVRIPFHGRPHRASRNVFPDGITCHIRQQVARDET